MESTEPASDTVELLRRWNEGDRGALEALLARHLEPLHRYVRSRLGRELRQLRREADSMDLVQAAAARVLEYVPAFVPASSRQFHGLLRRIVVNDLRNRLRAPALGRREPSRDRFGDSLLDLRPGGGSTLLPDRAALRGERQAEMRAWARIALEFLEDEEDRRLTLLAAVEEWSWREIGDELGIAPDAARMRFHRLLPRLANHVRLLSEGRLDELLADEA
jgi:RNA polymerase sigma factor (sigma-70 family)